MEVGVFFSFSFYRRFLILFVSLGLGSCLRKALNFFGKNVRVLSINVDLFVRQFYIILFLLLLIGF